MRGLTDAEHAELADTARPLSESHKVTCENERATLVRLMADSRVTLTRDEQGRGIWDLTDALRLALRLWPATRASAPAGRP